MILLDTNLVSEVMRPAPDPRITAWMDAQQIAALYLSAITVAELRVGVAILPAGRRRSAMNDKLERRILPLFVSRVRPFDVDCARAYADLIARARKSGNTVPTADGYIAAVALSNGFSVATRDTKPFVAAGVDVINPWGLEC